MKLEPRRIEAFLGDPGGVRVVLLHGADQGLVAERAFALVRKIAGSADDPFRVVALPREAAAALPDEMRGLSLTGGRRVIHVREAGESLAEPVRLALAGPGEALAVLEAGALTARSKLRSLVEASPDAMAIGCNPDDAGTAARMLHEALAARGVAVDADAARWLVERLGGDRRVLRQEAEKLALYAGDGGRIDLESARACVADQGALSLEDAMFSCMAGDVAGADRALGLAIAEGAAPVQIVRVALLLVQKLHQAALAVSAGRTSAEAVRSIRPPVFYKRAPAFTRALGTWRLSELGAAGRRLQEIERACKRTGSPGETLARQALLSLAQRGAVLSRR
jgi:DNA polymerase-3 subunit delta